jgi:hypothetical protein
MKTGTKLGLLALAIAAGTFVFWFHLAGQVNLPENRTGFVLVFLGAAALGITAYVKGTSLIGAIPPAMAILIGLFLPFTIYVSPQEVEAGKVIKVGDTIPRFSAYDDKGNVFDSASLNDHLVLIKFFRAHW